MTSSDGDFVRRIVIAIALVVGVLLLWTLSGVLLLFFGSVIVATLLRALADQLARWTPLSGRWSLPAACLLILVALSLALFFVGATVQAQVAELVHRLPEAWASFRDYLGKTALGVAALEQMNRAPAPSGEVLTGVAGALTSTGGVVADLVLVLIGGIYLAAQPRLYAEGVALLAPEPARARVLDTLEACGAALRSWLAGQLFIMASVGVLTGVGLTLVGLPAALALALFAALVEFVPFLGPLVSAVPGLLIAFAQGTQTLILTAVAYLVIHQIEGNVMAPIVMRHTVHLPPAVTIFAVLAFGALFGIPGIIFAAPLAVIVFTLVTKLYVREQLHEPVTVPGEKNAEVAVETK